MPHPFDDLEVALQGVGYDDRSMATLGWWGDEPTIRAPIVVTKPSFEPVTRSGGGGSGDAPILQVAPDIVEQLRYPITDDLLEQMAEQAAEFAQEKDRARSILQGFHSEYMKELDLKPDESSKNPYWVQTYSTDAIKISKSPEGKRVEKELTAYCLRPSRTNEQELERSIEALNETKKTLSTQAPVSLSQPTAENGYMRTPLTFHASIIKQSFSDPGNRALPSHPNTHDRKWLDPTQIKSAEALMAHADYEPIHPFSKAKTNLRIWDLPGVRQAELVNTEDWAEFGNTYNQALHKRLDMVVRQSDAIKRVTMIAYMLTSFGRWKDMKALLMANVPTPLHPVPVYIRGMQMTESSIIGISGPETGAMYLSSAVYKTGTDAVKGEISGTYTAYFAGLVHNPDRVEVINHIAPARILGGFDTTFYKFPHYSDNEVDQSEIVTGKGRSRSSLIVMIASPEEVKQMPGAFDLIGRTLRERFSNVNMAQEASMGAGLLRPDGTLKNEFCLSHRDFYEDLWHFRELIDHFRGEFGTWAYRTCFSVFDVHRKLLANFYPSTGPRAIGYGVGSAPVWNGQTLTMLPFDKDANAINP